MTYKSNHSSTSLADKLSSEAVIHSLCPRFVAHHSVYIATIGEGGARNHDDVREIMELSGALPSELED